MGPVFDAAFQRGLVIAVITYIAGFASFLLVPDLALRYCFAAAVAPALGAFATRAGYEGVIDTNRANQGIVNPGDVPEASSKLEVTRV
jgi:hypothetical protein